MMASNSIEIVAIIQGIEILEVQSLDKVITFWVIFFLIILLVSSHELQTKNQKNKNFQSLVMIRFFNWRAMSLHLLRFLLLLLLLLLHLFFSSFSSFCSSELTSLQGVARQPWEQCRRKHRRAFAGALRRGSRQAVTGAAFPVALTTQLTLRLEMPPRPQESEH